MSPFPTVAPSDRGSPPTSGTMRTLRRLLSLLGLLRLSLVSRYLAVPRCSVSLRVSGNALATRKIFDVPALPSCYTGLCHARSSQTSQVPESTLCTHAPLFDPGWLDNTTVTKCRRVLPSQEFNIYVDMHSRPLRFGKMLTAVASPLAVPLLRDEKHDSCHVCVASGKHAEAYVLSIPPENVLPANLLASSGWRLPLKLPHHKQQEMVKCWKREIPH